ncbi:carbohydrate kinase family protein [Rariglobus hedericola]|uniref:Carbohydrate kinase family protein n=1 Tax=Rariglobus hedericola TaxID=2597822 RepID=A0A556QNV4_9BACT|nr:carbohydrate kinase family protein [Rariglobus hedericola]TSJ78307.1 carbohydrate kinase family protein [Rariglobus hedericola]
MDFKARTLDALLKTGSSLTGKLSVVGLDGFVDTIVTPVALRTAQGEAFTPITTINEFGQRILGAAGKSTNIEFYPRMDKLGGNGPIMANALISAGGRLKYIGALGRAAIHPVFQEFAGKADVVSLADPASTTAVEFTDGKLMLGQMRSLDEITFERIVEKMGRAGVDQAFGAADLIALVNWTMIPNMTAIFEALVNDVLPALPAKDRIFFFDLADPEKRSRDDLLKALEVIGKFEKFGRVTLGLNLKEAQQVWAALDYPIIKEDEAGLRKMAADIRARLGLSTVVVHPKESAACATAEGTAWIPGPYTPKPLITTGAGDHFNAGFSNGQLLGLSPESCLAVGVCTSGHYVRTGQSPTLNDLTTFLQTWN